VSKYTSHSFRELGSKIKPCDVVQKVLLEKNVKIADHPKTKYNPTTDI
jgi:hypothetical protein